MQNEIELAPRSIRRKYVSIQQYCNYLRMVLNLNEIFFRFTARKFQLPRTLPRTLSREEIKELILAATFQYQQAWSEYKERLAVRNMCIIELLFCLGLRVGRKFPKMSAVHLFHLLTLSSDFAVRPAF